MRHLVVYNSRAGRGRAGRSPERVAAAFSRAGLEFELAETARAGHAGELVAERGAGADVVAVVGGDGTLHEALQTLDLSRHRLAVIPWGSGNDFAWLHGWTPDLDACVTRIAAGNERRIDLGLYEAALAAGGKRSARFHNSIGLGFEAVVNYESHRVTRVKGFAVYLVALARTLRRFRSYPIRMTWEGGEYEGEAALVTLANGKRVGGGFLLAPDALPDDGLLDLVYAGRLTWLQMLALLPRTLRGSHLRSSRVHAARSRRVVVSSPEGIPAYVDGEFLDRGVTELEVRVEPGMLRCL